MVGSVTAGRQPVRTLPCGFVLRASLLWVVLACCGWKSLAVSSTSRLVRKVGPGWSGTGTTPNFIKIGTTLSAFTLSDTFYKHSSEQFAGYRLFFKWLNVVRGGVHIGGQAVPVELTVIDDLSDVEAVRNNTRYLIDNLGIRLLLGPYGSTLSVVMAEEVNRSDALAIMPTASSEAVYKDRPQVFGIYAPAGRWFQGVFYSLNGTTARTVGYVRGSSLYERSLCSTAHEFAESTGMQVVYNRSFGDDVTDDELLDLAESANDEEPDVLLVCSYEQVCARLLTTMRERYLNFKMVAIPQSCFDLLGSHGTGRNNFFMVVSVWFPEFNFTSNITGGQPWSSDSFATTQWTSTSFETEFIREFHPINASEQAAAAFASAEVLVHAMEAANSDVPAEIAAQLQTMEYTSIFGSVSFAENGQNAKIAGIVQTQTMLDAPVVIFPEDKATGEVFYPMPQEVERPCYFELPVTDPFGFGAVKEEEWDLSDITKANVISAAQFGADKIEEPGLRNAIETYFNNIWPQGSTVDRVLGFLILSNGTEDFFSTMSPYNRAMASRSAKDYYLTDTGKEVCTVCTGLQVGNWTGQKRQCQNCGEREQVSILPENWGRICVVGCGSGQARPNGLAESECQDCPKGTFSLASSTGRTCRACSPGTFAGAPGSTECESCMSGTYASQALASMCLTCDPGTAAPSEGSSNCSQCPKGMLTSQPGASRCVLCPSGSIARNQGSTECEECDPGRFAAWGAAECKPCETGKFQPESNMSHCEDAVPGATFNGTGLVMGRNLKRYWANLRRDLDTVRWDYCYQVPDGCLEDERCGEGSTGIECTACMPGYAYHTFPYRSACTKCPEFWQLALITVLAILSCVIGSVIVTLLAVDTVRHTQDAHVVLFKIAIHYGVVVATLGTVVVEALLTKRLQLGDSVTELALLFSRMATFLHIGGLLDTGIWSVNCLVQPTVDEELKIRLEEMRHSDWYNPNNAMWVEKLQEMHRDTEVRVLIFWTLFPLIVCLVALVVSFVVLVLFYIRRRIFYKGANRFYLDLIKKGANEVKNSYSHYDIIVFRQEYDYHIMGVWWPFQYMAAVFKQGFCQRFRRFVNETKPIIFCVLFIVYAPMFQGITRPFYCRELGTEGTPTTRMVHASTIECTNKEEIFDVAIVLSVFWGIILPLLLLFMLVRRHRERSTPEYEKEHSILVAGYRLDVQWWESLVFFFKCIVILFGHLPLDPSYKILLQLMVSIVYGGTTSLCEPYDRRCNGVLGRMEIRFVFVWVTSALLAEIAYLSNESAVWAAVVVFNMICHLLFGLSLTMHAWEYGISAMLSRMALALADRGSGYRYLEALLDKNIKKMKHREPYVCFEHLLGWCTLCGDSGDKAEMPYIADGRRGHLALGRPELSDAPQVPERVAGKDQEPVKVATMQQRRLFHRTLAVTLEKVQIGKWRPHGGISADFSVSILEFVLRAGFFLGRERKVSEANPVGRVTSEAQTETNVMELHPTESVSNMLHGMEELLMEDCPERNELMRAKTSAYEVSRAPSVQVVGVQSTDVTMDATESRRRRSLFLSPSGEVLGVDRRHFDNDGNREEFSREVDITLELLEADLGEIYGTRKKRNSTAYRQMSTRHRRETTIREMVDKAWQRFGQVLAEWLPPGVIAVLDRWHIFRSRRPRKSSRKVDPDDDVEYYDLPELRLRQLSEWVNFMFNPALYQKGMRFQELQQGFMRLQALNKREIRFLLDCFEERWVENIHLRAFMLKRFANMSVDVSTQVNMALETQEIALLNPATAADQQKKAEALNEKHTRAALRWARLSLSLGNALTNFTAVHLTRAIRDSINKRTKELEAELSKEQELLEKEVVLHRAAEAQALSLRRRIIMTPNLASPDASIQESHLE